VVDADDGTTSSTMATVSVSVPMDEEDKQGADDVVVSSSRE
jgi:hypothetical protein